ncbi:MAG: hypothetical protein KIT31_04195 [Deltaproteobacteria bacterium]|nr:hypothetical protein [Deltaproteobacteria bacterium]
MSPDGTTVATAGVDGARLWSALGGTYRELRGHGGPVNSIAFAPDGKRVVTVANGTVRIWADDLPHDPSLLRAWLAAAMR